MSWPRPVPLLGDETSASQRAADPCGWRLGDAERRAFYELVGARRDVRRFRPDPMPGDVLARILAAAHSAPSVGHSQPWRFIVTTSAVTRERASLMAERERRRQAALLEEDRRRKMLDLQLDGIREAPVGIVVCCDRRAPASGVLGRATFPDADLWSCACAIENLWLAARVEGVGIGWVTLFDPAELADLVGLPEGVATLGWLCAGWPDERPPTPGLERSGWSRRLPLSSVVLRERWDGAPGPPESALRAPEPRQVVGARDESDGLLTPPGSLGALGSALDRLAAAGLAGQVRATLVLAAADHPVAALGVSAYPQSVTREVLEATVAGESLGAAAARATGMDVVAVDAGVLGGPVAGALAARPRGRRGDLAHSDAMEKDDTEMLLAAGRTIGAGLGRRLVALGEVGTANTTVAAALACALLGLSPDIAAGLGAGGDTAMVARKRQVVQQALSRCRPAGYGRGSPETLAVLGQVGGPELAVLAGVVLGCAEAGSVVVLDGMATSVAALAAVALEPAVAFHLVAAHRSREPAHTPVLAHLGLDPLLDVRARAGEGVLASLACGLLASGTQMRALAGRVEH